MTILELILGTGKEELTICVRQESNMGKFKMNMEEK